MAHGAENTAQAKAFIENLFSQDCSTHQKDPVSCVRAETGRGIKPGGLISAFLIRKGDNCTLS